MDLSRRRLMRVLASAAALPAVSCAAWGQAYPSRPVHVIVGFGAGGAPDIVARLLGQRLSDRLGQQFVVENRPGAGSNISLQTVARAPADGHTLLMMTSTNAINASLYEKLDVSLTRDIAPVASIGRVSVVMMVNPALPVRTVPEFIAHAKANPGMLNFGSSGTGNLTHLAGELFKMLAGVDLVHVPFRGEAQALTDLISGRVHVMFDPTVASIGHIKSGELRALAIAGGASVEGLPSLPRVSDFVPGYEAAGWFGVGAPKNTPPEIVATLNQEIDAGIADPVIKTRLADLGITPFPGSPADYGSFIAAEVEKWGKVIRAANIKLE